MRFTQKRAGTGNDTVGGTASLGRSPRAGGRERLAVTLRRAETMGGDYLPIRAFGTSFVSLATNDQSLWEEVPGRDGHCTAFGTRCTRYLGEIDWHHLAGDEK